MNSQLKAVIFDLDGLLVDTEPLWKKAYGIWLKEHNAKNDLAIYKKMIGRGLRENMVLAKKYLGVKGEVEELLRDLRGILYKLVSQKKDILMPGVLELLPKLGSYKLAVTTGGHDKQGAEKILIDTGIRKYFEAVVSSDDVENGKPAPDVYFEAAKQLGVEPLNCFVIEDSVNGVESGKAAGMKAYGVNNDKEVREELDKSGADEVYISLQKVQIP